MDKNISGGAQHFLGAHPVVEVLLSDSGLQGLLLEGGAILVGRLGDLSRLVVTNMGIESGYQHQGLANNLGQFFLIGLHALSTIGIKTGTAIG